MKKTFLLLLATAAVFTAGIRSANAQQLTAQQLESLFQLVPPERHQAAVMGYWQDFIKAARSGNPVHQQQIAALAPVIQKYDPAFKEHLAAAILALSQNQNQVPTGMMPNMQMPMPMLGGGGGGGRVTSRACPACHGSGNCQACKGTGTYNSYGQSIPCDPKCKSCGGTGLR